LSGFDDTIKVKPTMEYFQDKIALIAELNETLEVKTTRALELMNEMEMPTEQRQAWLDVL
jgi:hypothetical protein